MNYTATFVSYKRGEPVMSTYSRLYSGADGESHFEDIEIDLASTEYAPPAPPLDLSSFTPATQFGFMRAGRLVERLTSFIGAEYLFSCSAAREVTPATAKRGVLRPAACCSLRTRAEKVMLRGW
jgi:hypothetical protein